jgi:hypothetical protein
MVNGDPAAVVAVKFLSFHRLLLEQLDLVLLKYRGNPPHFTHHCRRLLIGGRDLWPTHTSSQVVRLAEILSIGGTIQPLTQRHDNEVLNCCSPCLSGS